MLEPSQHKTLSRGCWNGRFFGHYLNVHISKCFIVSYPFCFNLFFIYFTGLTCIISISHVPDFCLYGWFQLVSHLQSTLKYTNLNERYYISFYCYSLPLASPKDDEEKHFHLIKVQFYESWLLNEEAQQNCILQHSWIFLYFMKRGPQGLQLETSVLWEKCKMQFKQKSAHWWGYT